MKKLILIAIMILINCTSTEKAPLLVEIPDADFRAYLKDEIPDAFPEDGDKMDPNSEAVRDIHQILLTGATGIEVKSLKGIEYFTGLTDFMCSEMPSLKELDLSRNDALIDLTCSNNLLDKLDLRQNTNLQELGCSNNNLKNLDVSKNTKLKVLVCQQNPLTTLDLSHNPYLNKRNVYADKGVKIIWYKK